MANQISRNAKSVKLFNWNASDKTWIPFVGTITATVTVDTSTLAKESGGNLDLISTYTSRIPTLGQKLMLASLPVVIASDQTSLAVQMSDGAHVTLGAKADARSASTDATSITVMQVLKEISFMEQNPASRAVTNVGTFATQSAITAASGAIASGAYASGAFASGAFAAGSISSGAAVSGAFADGAIVTLGAKTDARSTSTDSTSITAMQVLKEISFMVQNPASVAVTNVGTFAVQATLGAGSAVIGHVIVDSGTITTVTGITNQVDTNLKQVAGTNTVTAGVSGLQAVGGNVANGVTATSNPIPVGGVFTTSPTTLSTGQTATLQFTAAQNVKNDITTIAGTAPTTAGFIDIKGADGNIFVRQATASNLNAAVVGTGTAGTPAGNILTVQGVAAMTKLLVTPDSVALPANQSVNVAQVGGTNTVTGGVAGIIAVGGNVANAVTATANPVPVGGVFATSPTTLSSGQTATLQFTAAQNLKHDITTIAGTAPTTVGKLDVKGADGDVFVRQATGTNLHMVIDSGTLTTLTGITNQVDVNFKQFGGSNVVTGGVAGVQSVGGNVANAVTATANPVPVGGVFTTSPTTLTTGQTATLQFTAAQNVKSDMTTWGAVVMEAATAQADGLSSTATIPRVGAVMAGLRSDGTANSDRAILTKMFDRDSGAGTEYIAGVSIRSSASGGSIDTFLTAVALADGAAAAPVTTTVGAVGLLMNATTVDRQRAIVNALNTTGTGVAAAGLVAQVDNTSPTGVTENQFGAVRMSTLSSVHVTRIPESESVIAPTNYQNAGSVTKANVKASAGNVFSIRVTNANAAARWFQLHNKATAPAATEVPQRYFLIPAGTAAQPASITLDINYFAHGINFATGIGWAISTTAATFTDAATAGDHTYDINYL